MTKRLEEISLKGPIAHSHTHSLFVRCLACKTFGIDMPTEFTQAVECGNCGSLETVKYYPSCCMINMFNAAVKELMPEIEKLIKAISTADKKSPRMRMALADWRKFMGDV